MRLPCVNVELTESKWIVKSTKWRLGSNRFFFFRRCSELTSPIVASDPHSTNFSKEGLTNFLILPTGPKAIGMLHNSRRLCLEALSVHIVTAALHTRAVFSSQRLRHVASSKLCIIVPEEKLSFRF